MPPARYSKALRALLPASVGFITWHVARWMRHDDEVDRSTEIRPFVIAGPGAGTARIAFSRSNLSMQLWNIGRAPAIVDSMSLRDGRGDLLAWGVTKSPVRPGAVRELRWPLTQRVPDDGERCALRIAYRDQEGIRYETGSELLAGRLSAVCAKFERTRVGRGRRLKDAESRLLSSAA